MKKSVILFILCLSCGIVSAQTSEPAKIGDIVEGGVLWYISADGTSGKVLYPGRSKGKMPFATESTVAFPETASADDGAVNVAILKKIDPSLASFPAAKYCEDLEGDWYLPASNEMKALFEAYNGTTWEGASGGRPESITPEEQKARNQFEKYIRAAGGVKLNSFSPSTNGTELWTSTWKSSSSAFFLRTGSRRMFPDLFDGTNSKSKAPNFARCIRKVSLK